MAAPTEVGQSPTILSGSWGASKHAGDHARAANMLHFKLEALKCNCQGQLDQGEGLTLRTWRKKPTPFSSKLSSTEEMDSGQILFICLKVSQILL